jgi:predicted TIM-barrel fold metal-dependent hydrolase
MEMIIDAHTHLFPPGMDKAGSAEMLLSEMQASGVDKAVILGIYPRVLNEFIAEQAQAHPNCFIGLASVNPNDGQDAVHMLDWCVHEWGAKGLKIHPTMQHFRADDIVLLAPLMRKVEELNIPVLMHSWGWFGQDGEADPSRVMTLAQTFPSVTFIMAHCGGMRFMDLLPLARLRQLGQLNNLYVDLAVILFDLVNSPMWPFLRWTLESIGLDRVLFGSDFPDYPLDSTLRLARSLGLDEQEMDLVLGKNAAHLFKLRATVGCWRARESRYELGPDQ